MQVPDAVLSPRVVAATGVLAVGGLLYGVRRLQSLLRERTSVPMGSVASNRMR